MSTDARGFERIRHCWFAVSKSQAVRRRPVGKVLLDTPIVLARLTDGVRAFLDRCPHRNAKLSEGCIRSSTIQCPYHGWRFDENGQCVDVPGRAGPPSHRTKSLEPIEIVERDGIIWATLASGELPPNPPSPTWFGDASRHSFVWQTNAHGDIANLIENFLDPAHTHFVHAGLVRRDDSRQPVRASVRPGVDRVEIEYTNEETQAGFISQFFERKRSSSFGRYIYPSTAEIEYRSASGTSLTIAAHFSPTVGDEVLIHAAIAVEGGPITGRLKRVLAWPLFRLALEQDRRIVRSQSENIERFGSQKFTSTEVDLVGSYVRRMLNDGPYRKPVPPRTINLNL